MIEKVGGTVLRVHEDRDNVRSGSFVNIWMWEVIETSRRICNNTSAVVWASIFQLGGSFVSVADDVVVWTSELPY